MQKLNRARLRRLPLPNHPASRLTLFNEMLLAHMRRCSECAAESNATVYSLYLDVVLKLNNSRFVQKQIADCRFYLASGRKSKDEQEDSGANQRREVAMEGAVPPCQQLPQLSISYMPEVLLHSIIASISNPLDRNNVALTCKGFRDLERATRLTLRVRRSPPEFLPKLGSAGFRNVTELDLSAFDPTAYAHADFGFSKEHRETVTRVLGEGLPNVKLLRVRQESFMMRCAGRAWPCMERLEIQQCPKGTEDPFWIDLDWVDVLGKLNRLVELSFVPRPWATKSRRIRQPFEGFIVSLGQSPRQYPSLTALRSCFFATDKVLSVIGKAMPNLACLELINNLLDVYHNGNAILTNEGIKHLSTDYPLLTDLRIVGDICSYTALQEKGVKLDLVGRMAFRAFCQSELSSLCLEGPMSLQLGVMADHLTFSQLKRLHLHWSGWHLEESKTFEELSCVTNLTDVSLGYLAEKEVDMERLEELVLTNKRLSQLELINHQGAYRRNTSGRDTLGFVATNARSLVSFTFESFTFGPTILEVVSRLSLARMRLQALKLRLGGIGVAVHSQEDWPALRSLSLEFDDYHNEQENLGCWLQTCSNLTSLRYQCITSSSSKYSPLPFLVNAQSLRHLEVGTFVTTKCIEHIMVLPQLRSVVFCDRFERVPKKFGDLRRHPNLQSIALQCIQPFENFSQYSDHVKSSKVGPLLEPLLESKSLQQVKSNFDISNLSSEFKRRLYVAP